MSEWFKELVLKTSDSIRSRGFESHRCRPSLAGVMELVDMQDLGSCEVIREGSSPAASSSNG